jgi:diguanylate cyclase (GGDEF)-like protein
MSGQRHPPEVSPCATEPIHVPGAIQPHGALLAVLIDSRLVSHASANLGSILGRPAEAVLGRSLQEAFGPDPSREWFDAQGDDESSAGGGLIIPGPNAGLLHVRAFRTGRHLCVDIEPLRLQAGQASPIERVQTVMAQFARAGDRVELCDMAVRGLRSIMAYDRVMAYRFAEDGHGEVIAEALSAGLEPYLGLHYPASDIPPQARRLYLRQPVGAIADSSYIPVPLLVDAGLDDGVPLDLTHSVLRSASPVHREYMRNMKTAASLTIALVERDELWGMLVCHHTTPRMAGPDTRAVAAPVGQIVSVLLDTIGRVEVQTRRLEGADALRALVGLMAQPLPLADALDAAQTELLQLVAASGALLHIDGTTRLLGQTPPLAAVQPVLDLLRTWSGGDVLAVDDLGLRFPEFAACARDGSGAMLMSLAPGSDDAILWWRPELLRTVDWGGNPAEHAAVDARSGRLCPRASFAAWSQAVSGCSKPWDAGDLVLARELRGALQAEMAQRVKSDLARLRHYDSLTGLANRSLFQEHLAEAEQVGQDVALLFFDLDRFKAVNDVRGHAAGDALLIEVARRLLAVVGKAGLAARLGGDEFVVLCPGLDHDAATRLGEQIRLALEAPFEVLGHPCHIAASIGIAVASRLQGLDLVRAADMAMYAAKQRGGNRAMLFVPELYDRAARQFELDHDLRVAIQSDDQLVLLYQPLFGITGGARTLIGFEALLRWHHPQRGWMSPDALIPLAEKLGLISALGDWVLTTALRQGRTLRQARPEAGLWISVNVSGLQLAQAGFCGSLAAMLQAQNFAPADLCLEVTEGMLTDLALSYVLADLRKLGVRVAIDEFGIGHSSLTQLAQLAVEVVKLDRSFLENFGGDAQGLGFIGAVISLAHAAGMAVVVDGIETQAQFDAAAAAGADMVQGFLFARPLSAAAATAAAAGPAWPMPGHCAPA